MITQKPIDHNIKTLCIWNIWFKIVTEPRERLRYHYKLHVKSVIVIFNSDEEFAQDNERRNSS